MRILVAGASGKLGSLLVDMLSATHEVHGFDQAGDQSLNITDFDALRKYVDSLHPDCVINAAAWTDVDGCALDPARAIQINGYGAQNLAIAAHRTGASIVQISSNEVFNGRSNRPYTEYDRTEPVNPYGYSKWVGEQAVIQTNPKHYIVRTSWLFAHGGRNFLQAILGAADAGKALRVVTDEVANPTYTDDLAEAINKLILTERYGFYHLVNTGSVSRYAFARYALDRAGYGDTPITPITGAQWPRPSTPPRYAGLANLAGSMIGIELRPWQEAVDAFFAREGITERS